MAGVRWPGIVFNVDLCQSVSEQSVTSLGLAGPADAGALVVVERKTAGTAQRTLPVGWPHAVTAKHTELTARPSLRQHVRRLQPVVRPSRDVPIMAAKLG